jgi:hypothetical protein
LHNFDDLASASGPIDWNCNGIANPVSVKADINWEDGIDNLPIEKHVYTIFGTQNNWASINFSGGGSLGIPVVTPT